MKYKKIWNKILNKDEKVKFEFSIGDKYRKLGLILWAVISVLFLFVSGVGVIIFLFALFYFGFYLKIANAYAFTNKRVLIHKGWLSTHVSSVDYSKITDIKIREPFLDRIIINTGHLSINTAGSNLHEINLKHIEKPYEIKKKLDSLMK